MPVLPGYFAKTYLTRTVVLISVYSSANETRDSIVILYGSMAISFIMNASNAPMSKLK